MTEVPKIVYDRLRASGPERALPGRSVTGRSVPESAHPDADLLAAFAEQALAATERDGVLEHLALCGDCREVVALALPDAGMVAVPTEANTEAVPTTAIPPKSRWSWLSSPKLAWPSLRWAALAAGIAVAASVLLLHPGKLNQAMLPAANRQVALTAQPAASPQIASPVVSPPVKQSSSLPKTDEARPPLRPKLRPSKKLKAGQAEPMFSQAQSGMLLAGNRTGVSPGDNPLAAPSAAAPAFKPGESAPRSITETVEVAAADAAVETGLMVRNDAPPVVKAKPPLQEEVIGPQETQASAGAASARLQGRNAMPAAKLAPSSNQTLAHNVAWVITAGVLQRSLDSGQSWQNALRADRPLLCYASHEADMWAGGQAGALFHSVDSGVTWLQVQPSSKGQSLSSDVTRIDIRNAVRGPSEIVVSTNNNEIWSSADGGKTWQKK
jgi:hypothetical protein